MKLLYTKLKIFHFKEKLDSLPLENEKILPPVHIRIKPTNVCNQNCQYCAYRADNLQLGQNMNIKDFIPKIKMMEIVEDVIDMGVKAVTFSGGGEPFCYPHLFDVVNKISELNVHFAALTNGSRLKGKIAEIFAHGTWLRVSIDGWDDESYCEYRRVQPGEFTKVMNNMECFKKLKGKCTLGVSVIADRKNATHLYGLINRLKSIGVDSVKVSPCIVSNDGSKNNQYHKPVFEEVKEQLRKAISDMSHEDFEIYDAYHDFEKDFKINTSWCPYIQILPVIGADLNVYSCQDKAYNKAEGLIGSINGQRLKELWFADKEQFFKINPSSHCKHHCVANEKNNLIIEYLNAEKEHLEFV